jgi:hypothetical protein
MAEAPISQFKTCTKCQQAKPLDDFAKNPTGSFGRRGDCKACRRRYCKSWYDDLEQEAKTARHQRDGKAEWQAAYYQRNKERHRVRCDQWAALNRERHKECMRNAMRRRRSSAKGRLESNVGGAVYRALRGRKGGSPSFQLLGFTIEDLMAHLERQFREGMTWDNYGQWHVDHIRPLASFSYEKPDDLEFKLAWALTNLRPLWAKDNIAKGGRRSHLI